jgi:hypothetical protein
MASEPDKFRPTQVQAPGVSPSKFVNTEFLGLLSRELPGVKAVILHFIYSPSGEGAGSPEAISLGHYNPEQMEKQVFTVDCESPETLTKVMRAVESHLRSG